MFFLSGWEIFFFLTPRQIQLIGITNENVMADSTTNIEWYTCGKMCTAWAITLPVFRVYIHVHLEKQYAGKEREFRLST